MQQTPPRTFLYIDQGSLPWDPDVFTRSLQRHTLLQFGCSINTRQWRHIAIALDRRALQGVGCGLYGVLPSWGHRALRAVDASDSDEELVDLAPGTLPAGLEGDRMRQFQASHTPAVGNATYGNDLSLSLGMTDALLAAFHEISVSWHKLAGLGTDVPPALKRPLSLKSSSQTNVTKRVLAEKGSSLQLRRQTWTGPVIEDGLKRLFGPSAAPRDSMQRDGLQLLARSRPETIVVTPTGSGKSVLYVVLSLLPRAEVTVVIVPLIALRQDMVRRYEQWQIPFRVWPAGHVVGQLYAVPSLLLVDIGHAVRPDFAALLSRLQLHRRLDRIVLEEAHLLLTASHYREKLPRWACFAA